MDDFSDDDEFLESVKKLSQTQVPSSKPHINHVTNFSKSNSPFSASSPNFSLPNHPNLIPDDIKLKLYKADGEVAILRNQLEQARLQNHQVNEKLKLSYEQSKHSMEEQMKMMKFTIQKLEDEKKFLDNQIKSGNTKKRKLEDKSPPKELVLKGQHIIRVPNDITLLTDYIWRLSINGSERSIMEYLDKIAVSTTITIGSVQFPEKLAIAGVILKYLVSKKDLRLDKLLKDFLSILIELVKIQMDQEIITCVPFVLALIHGILGFKPSAIDVHALSRIMHLMCSIINVYGHFALNEDPDLFNYNKTPQVILLEKFTLICAWDVIETGLKIYDLSPDQPKDEIFGMIQQCMIEMSRDLYSTQININYNWIEIFDNYYESNPSIPMSLVLNLMEINLLGVPIKDDFRVFGLNRCIGNNIDFQKIDSVIFTDNEMADANMLIIFPYPISKVDFFNDGEYKLKYNHEHHLLDLRLSVNRMIEKMIIQTEDVEFIKHIDIVKKIIQTIDLEQNYILRSPRSNFIATRLKIISTLIRVLNYLFKSTSQLNEFIDTESLNELSIILSRIAFSSNPVISKSTAELYKMLRGQNYKLGILNKSIETRGRNLSNIDFTSNKNQIAEVEMDYANGIENAYDSETIELSREILASCIDTETADNLYINVYGNQDIEEKFEIINLNSL